jgi:hypothetical protein
MKNLVLRAKLKFRGYASGSENSPNPKHEIRNPKQYIMI